MQGFDVGSYSEASTVDPVTLIDLYPQPKKTHLPKDCCTESKYTLCITGIPNELILKGICLNVSRLTDVILLSSLYK